MSQERFKEIDYAKGVGILLVVIGHSFPDVSSSSGISVFSLRLLHDIIYTFHMPLMFFISGFLSVKLLNKKEMQNYRVEYIYKRFNRLMIPYFLIAIIYMPIKIVFSKFANNPYDIRNIWQIFLGENPNGGLWYLYVLFFIQVIICIILSKHNLIRVTISSIILSIVILLIPNSFFRIDDIGYYLSFTCIGICIGVYYEQFIKYIRKSEIMIFTIISFILVETIYIGIQNVIIKYICALLGILLIMAIAIRRTDSCQGKKNRLYDVSVMNYLAEYSMDIYILHGIVMVAIRILMVSILHANYYITCFVMFLGGLFASLFVSRVFIRRSRILSKLFLGND